MNATKEPSLVIPQRPDIQSLVDELSAVVYARAGQLTITEVIGALEVTKYQVLKEQYDD